MLDVRNYTEIKYDESGRIIYYKTNSGESMQIEYDSDDNISYMKGSDGYEIWLGYDEKGNKIHCKTSNESEEWFEYDESGEHLIHSFDTLGSETLNSYDDCGRQLSQKITRAGDVIVNDVWRYDDDKNQTIRYSTEVNRVELTKYNEKGDVINKKITIDTTLISDEQIEYIGNCEHSFNRITKYGEWIYYDNSGNDCMRIGSTGVFNFIAYDRNGVPFYYIEDGIHKYFEHDEFERPVHAIFSNGYEEWWEYDDNLNVLLSYHNTEGHVLKCEIVKSA